MSTESTLSDVRSEHNYIFDGRALVKHGAGAPDGNTNAWIYIRTDGAAGTVLYFWSEGDTAYQSVPAP